jgi:Spy/CpxP family protein refolding chaperone
MSIKRWAGVAALGALLVTGGAIITAVSAQGGPSMGRWGGPGRSAGWAPALRELGLRALDLTDAQREQVRGIEQSHRDERRQLAERLRTAHVGLQEVVQATSFDEAAIRSRSAEVAAVQADMAVLRARIRGEVWAILTPEQQQTATERHAKAAERRQQRRPQ